MILAPLFDLTLLIRSWGTPLQDIKSAALAVPQTGFGSSPLSNVS